MKSLGMKSILWIPLILLAIPLCLGCSDKEPVENILTPYSEDIVSGTDTKAASLLSAFDPSSSKGRIAILDSPQRAARAMDYFLNYDSFDNVDASRTSDLLPDFSGETIVALNDSHFEQTLSESDSTALKEYAVRSLVNALDTAVAAKAFVITSSKLSLSSEREIRDVLSRSAADIPVILPIRIAAEKIHKTFGVSSRVLIITDDDPQIAGNYYASIFNDPFVERIERESDISRCVSEYFMKDGQGLLAAIIVDDFAIDPTKIQSTIEKMLTVEIYKGISIGRVLEKNYAIVDCRDIAAQALFHEFRNRNIFTHTIAYPIGLSADVQN